MKKLMVLSMVLAIGAFSSAAFVLDVSDVIGVSTEAPISAYELVLNVVDGDLVLGEVVFNSEFAWDFAPKHITPATPKSVYLGASQFFSPAQGPGNLFLVGFEGTGTIELRNKLGTGLGDPGELLASVYIPEPMTMGLLGVGALFLRRRK